MGKPDKRLDLGFDATLKLWKDYGLFSLSGMDARLGAGEKDLSMLFTYVAADRYLEKGEKTEYPVPYVLWKKKKGVRLDAGVSYEEALDRTDRVEMQAKPIGTPVSSWQTFEAKTERILDTLRGESI